MLEGARPGLGLGVRRGDLGRGVEVLPIDSLERTLQMHTTI